VKPGNPLDINSLTDLPHRGIRFVNRQEGSGTRVWLDSKLAELKLDPRKISGYENVLKTHTEVAQAIAEDRADVGLGVETTALAYGLDFVFQTKERYDFVIPADIWETGPILALRTWLNSPEARESIARLGGYETAETGHVRWVPS
jgi:putative molybdopterin biosynthesis protein